VLPLPSLLVLVLALALLEKWPTTINGNRLTND
jgi:hypothetical protein